MGLRSIPVDRLCKLVYAVMSDRVLLSPFGILVVIPKL